MEHSSSKMTSMVMILLVIASCLSISQVPRAEASQCDSNKECKNYLCQAPSLPYCFDGAFFRCLSCLRHCPAATVRNPVACAAKKLIHRRTDLLPPSVLQLQDSDHNTSAAIGKISRSSTQPRKNQPHTTSDAPPCAAQSSGAVILGSPATGLRSRHIHRRWKDLEKLDPTAQDSSSLELGRASTRRPKFRRRQALLHAPHFVMAQSEISKPIHVILDGDNYSLWAQGMCSFLKGRKLWLYVTGQRHPPTQQKDETEDAFALRLEDWDGINHQIITWLRNTSTPSVSMEFGGYDTTKDVWDMLASRYAGSDDAREYHLMVTLYQLRQDPGERITAFHSRMRFLWDQLAASEPVIKSVFDAKLVSTHRERTHLHQFLMGVLDDFEFVRSQLLNRSPLPTVNQAVNDLVREETRLKSHHPSQPHTTVFATPVSVDPTVTAPSKSHDKRRSNKKNSHLICAFCKHRGHTIDQYLQALFNQVQVPSSSASNPTLSVTPGISSEWFLDSACCNHMTDNPHLTSAHTPPVLPTITTADGSAMTDSQTGQIVGTARKVGRLFELTSLHFPSSSVSAPIIACFCLHRVVALSFRLSILKLLRYFALTMHENIDKLIFLLFLNTMEPFFILRVLAPHNKMDELNYTPSTAVLHLSFKTQHHMNGYLAQLQTIVYSRFLVVSVLFFFNHMSAPNFNPAPSYVVFLAMASKKRGTGVMIQSPNVFESLGMWYSGNTRCSIPYLHFLQVMMILRLILLPNLFPEIPSPSAELVNPISDESPSADPSSDVSPTTDPTFDESPLSASAANPINTTTPEPRRFHRVSTLPSHLRDFHCFSTFATLHEPHTFRKASSDPLWQQAMKEELDALLKTGTWDLVDLPAGKSAIGCKWVYKIKTRSDGTVDRYKARLVAKGFTQEYGIDYEETFAPVARLSSVRTLIAVSASRHWQLFQIDVKNAFLNGELTEEVYMQLPPGFSQPPGFSHKVCRLRRVLYGLKQAPRAWFAKFSSTISQHGFSASSYDSALFFGRSDHGITLFLLYVDDMIITGDDVQGIQDLKRFLGQHFEMKDLGPLSYFLGLEVSSSSDGYYLTQAKYTSDLISQAGITDSKIVDTSIEYNNHLNTHDGEPLPDATLYRQLVGSLVYLTVTRPDISYAVHIVSQFMAAPRSLHYAAVLRILRYLKGTLFHGLHFSSQSSLTLQAYSDADWAGDPTDRRSTIGTEAEYRALADTTAELLWLRWLFQDLCIDCSTVVPIHCNNRSAIQIAHNDVFHERTKYIEIDCHFVRHHLLQGTLQLRSVSSQDQLADIFTKPMPPGRFRDLISKLKLVSLHPT
uniref:Reverse transcriptase Ty1/copia-type domain-containing protein n=1 Tax=Fagus sylvatica TaxID=28930 RepID=A0A2N9HM41_FAGSY